MQMKLNAMLHNGRKFCSIPIFGYSTQGIPGVDVIGLGKMGRSLKEKIIFLTKSSNFKIPLRRFVLCIDVKELPDDLDELRLLELPFLILFWSLSGILPITCLDDCFACGRIDVSGTVESLDQKGWMEIKNDVEKNGITGKYLGVSSQSEGECQSIRLLPLQKIFSPALRLDFNVLQLRQSTGIGQIERARTNSRYGFS